MTQLKRIFMALGAMTIAACSSDQPASPPPTTDAVAEVPPDALPDTSTDWHPETPFAVAIDDYPRVDGATATLPLEMIVACELLGVPWTWASIGGGETSYEYGVVPTGPLAEALKAKIVHNKTHEAFLNLVDGKADLILQANLPSTDELAYAASKGVTYDAKAIALDALVFLVNPANPVTNLTVEQVRAIYLTKFTKWNEVGGLDHIIHPYTRPPNSGSFELFKALILKEEVMPAWPPDLVASYMGALVNKIASDPDGLGYSVYYYVRYIVPLLSAGTKMIAIEGVDPTASTLATRKYPLTTETYVVTRKDLAASSIAYKLRDWLLAPDGQRVVKMSGYVPITP